MKQEVAQVEVGRLKKTLAAVRAVLRRAATRVLEPYARETGYLCPRGPCGLRETRRLRLPLGNPGPVNRLYDRREDRICLAQRTRFALSFDLTVE